MFCVIASNNKKKVEELKRILTPLDIIAKTPAELGVTLDEVEDLLDGIASTVPMRFAEEAGLPSGARDVRVSDDGTVVGFAVDSEPDEAIASINEIMETKGWTAIDLGGIDGETYVKNEGPYAQVVMTATQVGGSTSVVMRCMRR